MIKKYRNFRFKSSSATMKRRIILTLIACIGCFLIVSSFYSNNIYTNILNNIDNDKTIIDKFPKTSAPPTFSIDSPSNYSLFGKIAPNYSLTITAGGNFTWYEFIEPNLGVNSTPIELEGTDNEYFETPFNQTMWNSLSNGTATVRFYVNNSLGETGYLDAIIRIDIRDPIINILSPTGGFFNSTPPDYNVDISDPNLNTTWYTLNTNQTKHIFTTNGPIEGWSYVADGLVTITFYANDSVSNENSDSVQVTKDIIDPGAPSLLISDPSSWTNVSSFDLYWTNPSDDSGIVGAYYKLYSAPDNDTDGVYVPGVNIESILEISVSSDDVHDVYIWLNDSAGNGNHLNYNSTQLYLDTTAPSIPLDFVATPDSWTDINDFDLSWTNPSDDSGIIGAYYKLYSAPDNDTDGVYVPGVNIESILGISVSSDGVHDVYVWLNDSVGNIDRTNIASTQLSLDTSNPILVINQPTDLDYYKTRPPINITVYDPNLDFLIYTVTGHSPSGISLENNTQDFLNQDIWDSLPEGAFSVEIIAVDTFNHRNDTFILTLYKDTIAPSLTVNSPINNTYWNLAPYLNITAVDPNFDTIWYSVYNVNITIENNKLEQLNSSIWNSLLDDEEQFEIKFYANDSFGHINNTYSRTLYKDIVVPTLIINSPLNNTYHKIEPIINVTVLDPYFHSLWYRVDTQNVPLINNTNSQLNRSIWDNLIPEEGSFIIYFYANDSAGNLNELFRLDLNKDIRDPVISIKIPGQELIGQPAPDFEISIDELNLNRTWYMLYNQTWNSANYSFNGVIGKINQTAWEEFGDGNVTIRFYANDTLNNIGYNETTVLKNTVAPIITIYSPADDQLFGIEAPNITQIYKAGLELDTTWYTLDGGTTNFTFSGSWVVINQTAWADYDFGDVIITFYINDSLGIIGFDVITLQKDPNPPLVYITYTDPVNNSYCAAEPSFRITVYEPNIDSIWYRVGATNKPIINNTIMTLNDTIWNSLSQGKFIIEVFAIDILGYLNDSFTLTFYKDTLAPILVINQPYDGNYYNAAPPINVTVYEPNLAFLKYTVINYFPLDNWITDKNNTEVPLNPDIWQDLAQGAFQIEFTCFDDFGQSTVFSLTLYKDTIGPIFENLIPSNSTCYNSAPFLMISYLDPNLQTIYFKIDTYTIPIPNNTLQAFNSSIWDGLTDDPFTIEFYANDTFGYNSTSVYLTLIKDTTIPQIIVNSPNNSTVYSEAPTMDISISDLNPGSIWYTVNTLGTNVILSGLEALDSTIWSDLDQGEFQVYIFANDSAGNLNDSVILTLYKDTVAPLVTVNLPLNNTYWSDNLDLIFNVTAYDPNLDSIYYQVLGRPQRYLTNNTDAVFSTPDWILLQPGPFFVDIFAEDSLGNINDSIRLILYKDIVDPVINIISPQPDEIYGEISPDFEISIIEPNLNQTWYMLYNQTWNSLNYLFNESTGKINQVAWEEFWNGTVTIRFYANDTAGNVNYEYITIQKNIYDPIITINSPGDDDLFGITAPNFIIYKSGPELNTTWYTLDNGLTNVTFTELSGQINQTVWDTFNFETITVRFYINDTFGKVGFDEVSIRKDPDMPIIIVNSPNNHTAYASSPFIDLTIIEPNLDKVWYRINTIVIDITANFTQFINVPTWNSLPQGEFTVELFANDTMGNINNFTTLHLSKDTIGPNITIIRPTENQKVGRNAPTFDLLISDDHEVDLRWYTIGIGSTPREFTDLVGIIDQNLWEQIWDDSTQGEIIIIRFYAEDALGNEDFKEINLIVEKPLDLPRYLSEPLGLLISSLTLAVMVPVTVKLVKSRYYKALNVKVKRRLRKVLITAAFFLSLLTLYFIF